MKTFDEWYKEIPNSDNGWIACDKDEFSQVQLDAFKAGMTHAANIPDEMRGSGESDLRCVRDRIKFAAEQLTELPIQ